MAIGDGIAITVGIIAILGSCVSIGTWIGLRRAESKRIVKAEMAIAKFRDEMEEAKEKAANDLREFIRAADERYARKDVIEANLEFMKEKQKEISIDVKEIKRQLGNR